MFIRNSHNIQKLVKYEGGQTMLNMYFQLLKRNQTVVKVCHRTSTHHQVMSASFCQY